MKKIAEKEQTVREENENPLPARRKKVRSLCALGLLLALFLVVTITVGKPLLAFVSDSQQFRAWVDTQGVWGRLAFLGMMCLQVVVAIIPGEALEIGAGYAFGAVEGMALCLLGTAIASALICLFTRKLGMKMVEAFVSKDKIASLSFLRNEKKLNLLVFLLFFIPGTPKDILTYFIGVTSMKVPVFLLVSTVARIPSVITSTMGGQALGSRQFGFALAVFLITGAISLAGLYVYHRMLQKKGGAENGQ